MIKQLTLFVLLISIYSCNSDNDSDTYQPLPKSEVQMDLNTIPYQKLSDYKFFKNNLKDMEPTYHVIPFEPASALFTDYAQKKRFVWVPDDTKIEFNGGHNIFKFPTASALIKSFYYDNVLPANTKKIIETRVMIKTGVDASGDDVWLFANYIWNDTQTEAFLDLSGQDLEINFINEYNQNLTTTYRIPSESECLTCHKFGGKAIPIGPKPQNIDFSYSYTSADQNQIDYWQANGILVSNFDRTYPKTINWKDNSQDLNLRVRSYVDANCAHCHRENSHCAYREVRFAFNETTNPSNLGTCLVPQENIGDEYTYIVNSGRASKSVLFARISTTNERIKMPLIGRNLVDSKAVEMIENWINNQTNICN